MVQLVSNLMEHSMAVTESNESYQLLEISIMEENRRRIFLLGGAFRKREALKGFEQNVNIL